MARDCDFIQSLGPDFGFRLFGSSDRGSQRSPGHLTFPLYYVPHVTQWRKWLEIVTHLSVTGPWCRIRTDVLDFLSGSTDSSINFSRSTDLHTHIHRPQTTSRCFSRNQFIDSDNPYSRQGRGPIRPIMYQSNRSLNIPPGQPPAYLNFWKIFVQVPPSRGWKAVQMPHHGSIPGDQMSPPPENVSVASIMLRKRCM